MLRCVVCAFLVLRFPYIFTLLHRMCAVISFVIPILETVAAHCALPPLSYLTEVTEDGSVLAGVELELPGDGAAVPPQRKFFWSVALFGSLDAYEKAALQAIRFLQGIYGFVLRDYNYDCMLAYRSSLYAAVSMAAFAVRDRGCLQREPTYRLLVSV